MPGPCASLCINSAKDGHIGCNVKVKRKGSLMIYGRHPEYRDKYGRHFWAGGYYVETVGQVDEDAAKKYIEEQEECSRIEG